jgi:hypothetical protein
LVLADDTLEDAIFAWVKGGADLRDTFRLLMGQRAEEALRVAERPDAEEPERSDGERASRFAATNRVGLRRPGLVVNWRTEDDRVIRVEGVDRINMAQVDSLAGVSNAPGYAPGNPLCRSVATGVCNEDCHARDRLLHSFRMMGTSRAKPTVLAATMIAPGSQSPLVRTMIPKMRQAPRATEMIATRQTCWLKMCWSAMITDLLFDYFSLAERDPAAIRDSPYGSPARMQRRMADRWRESVATG